MIYVFEDDPTTSLPTLFQTAYVGSNVKLQYSYGASKMLSLVSDLIQDPTVEDISVFVDVIPDNHNTIYSYNRLVAYAQGYKNRLYVFPIVSAEHYFIRSVKQLLPAQYSDALTKCLEVLPWKGSTLLETAKDLEYATSFEKFCKLFLLKAVPDCMKITPGDGTWKNEKFAVFYTEDCVPVECPVHCSLSLQDKALNYVKSYPVFPPLTAKTEGVRDMPDSSFVHINHSLCKLHEVLLKRFLPEGNTDALIPIYSLSDEEYARAYKKYKLRKYSGSMAPVVLGRSDLGRT